MALNLKMLQWLCTKQMNNMKVDDLINSIAIYAEAIYELTKDAE